MLLFPFGNQILQENNNLKTNMDDLNIETIYFGAGCFWCVEAIFQQVDGVVEVIPGCGGFTKTQLIMKSVLENRTCRSG